MPWLKFSTAGNPSPVGLLLGAALALASGLALANVWRHHRQSLARDRAHWAALAARRGWHLVERSGTFSVIGAVRGISFHLSQGAVARGDIAVFLEARLPRSPWLVCEVFAPGSPVAGTARRPGVPCPLPPDRRDHGLQLWSSHRTRALQLCDPTVFAALGGLPRPYLLFQNGIVLLIWPCTSLPSDAQLDAAIASLQALADATQAA